MGGEREKGEGKWRREEGGGEAEMGEREGKWGKKEGGGRRREGRGGEES